MLGWDTDNGGEFINWALIEHFKKRKPPVSVTRSRPYHKNDQAYVEQKNSTHARGLLGWDRLGHEELVAPCNELLELWSLWGNLYRPTMRQVFRKREKGKIVRRHEKEAKTPARRLLESGQLEQKQAAELKEVLEENDPFAMKEEIESCLQRLWERCRELDKKSWEEDEDPSTEGATPALEQRLREQSAASRRPVPSASAPEQSPLPNASATR